MGIVEIGHKIESKEKLNENEIISLINECEVDRKWRWSCNMDQQTKILSIVKVASKYYAIYWLKGIVEGIYRDTYDSQPLEVFPEQVTLTEWRDIHGVPV